MGDRSHRYSHGQGRVALPLGAVTLAGALFVTALLLFAPVVVGAARTRAWASSPRPVPGVHVVLQEGRFDCGPALIATLASWAGSSVPLDVVSGTANVGPTGVTLAEFARTAAVHGVPGSWYAVRRSRLEELATPFVAHLGRGGLGHFVAVVSLEGGLALIADPAKGAVVGGASELLRDYSGRVYLPAAYLSPGGAPS